MRWRTTYRWALGAFVVFVALQIFAGRPNLAVGRAGGVSAPSAPIASVESTPAAQLQHSHFDSWAHALRSYDLPLAFRVNRAAEAAHRVAGAAQPHYGPLHRRPPPYIS